MSKLRTEVAHDEIHFWGKIEGTVKDYHVALGLNFNGAQLFPTKTFYWCSSRNYNFAELPKVCPKSEEKIAEINSLFTGEYDTILATQDGETKELFLDDDDTLPIVIKPKNVTELDRLASVVHKIEGECHVVPEGSLKLTPIREVRPNEAFSGLSKDDSLVLGKYSHFRAVSSTEKKEQMDRDDSIFVGDWMDSIGEDTVKGGWSLTSDISGTTSILRNLRWPGYTAFHKANTSTYGSFYFGDGKMNKDLVFML